MFTSTEHRLNIEGGNARPVYQGFWLAKQWEPSTVHVIILCGCGQVPEGVWPGCQAGGDFPKYCQTSGWQVGSSCWCTSCPQITSNRRTDIQAGKQADGQLISWSGSQLGKIAVRQVDYFPHAICAHEALTCCGISCRHIFVVVLLCQHTTSCPGAHRLMCRHTRKCLYKHQK